MLQSPVVNVKLVVSTDTSVPCGTLTDTVTAAVGSESRTTVYVRRSPSPTVSDVGLTVTPGWPAFLIVVAADPLTVAVPVVLTSSGTTITVSFGSATASASVAMVIVPLAAPAAIVSVPLGAV